MEFLPTKGVEYLLVVGYLVLLIPFWRVFFGERSGPAALPARARLPLLEMFRMPDGVLLHPGHAWARADGADVAAVGLDDFAQQLVGRLKQIELPRVGQMLAQGAPAWRLYADSKSVEMLSPVTGEVIAVNERVRTKPGLVNRDPFEDGWLIKVRTPRLATDRNQLLAGPDARRWTEASWEDLSALFAPQLGTVLHDGGVPVDGLARAVDEEHWDVVARRFLRTG